MKAPVIPRIQYTPELGAIICERLTAGESLRTVCESAGMPSPQAVLAWTTEHPEFAEQYVRARRVGYLLLGEDLLAEADEAPERIAGGGIDSGSVNDKRLRVDTRKWMLSKMLPKVFGEKLALEHSGEINVRTIDDEERAAKIAAIFAAVERRLNPPADGSDLA